MDLTLAVKALKNPPFTDRLMIDGWEELIGMNEVHEFKPPFFTLALILPDCVAPFAKTNWARNR